MPLLLLKGRPKWGVGLLSCEVKPHMIRSLSPPLPPLLHPLPPSSSSLFILLLPPPSFASLLLLFLLLLPFFLLLFLLLLSSLFILFPFLLWSSFLSSSSSFASSCLLLPLTCRPKYLGIPSSVGGRLVSSQREVEYLWMDCHTYVKPLELVGARLVVVLCFGRGDLVVSCLKSSALVTRASDWVRGFVDRCFLSSLREKGHSYSERGSTAILILEPGVLTFALRLASTLSTLTDRTDLTPSLVSAIIFYKYVWLNFLYIFVQAS